MSSELFPHSKVTSVSDDKPNLVLPEFPGFMGGGDHQGVFPVACWNAETAHPFSVKNTLDFLNRVNRMPHYIWDPFNGDLIQCLPLDAAGKQYRKDINRGGKPCIQIAVCMRGLSIQITDTLCKALESILSVLEGLGVPPVFPLGVPSPYGLSQSLLGAFPEAGHYAGNQIDPSLEGVGRLNVKLFFETDRTETENLYE